MEAICPVAYDHADEQKCAVCGWGSEAVQTLAHGPLDMDNMTGPEQIREAIARLSGAYAPPGRVVVCDSTQNPPADAEGFAFRG